MSHRLNTKKKSGFFHLLIIICFSRGLHSLSAAVWRILGLIKLTKFNHLTLHHCCFHLKHKKQALFLNICERYTK